MREVFLGIDGGGTKTAFVLEVNKKLYEHKEKTKTENIPNLERTLSIESTNETPAIGAAIKRISKKTPIISRGIPILLIKLFFLVIYCLHFSTH